MSVSRAELSSELLVAALEALPDAVALVDLGGTLLLHNHRFEEIRTDVERAEGVVHRSGGPARRPSRDLVLPDGRILERRSTPVHDAAGGQVGELWTYRDVTWQRRRQARDERSLKRLALLERLEHAARALDRALTPDQVLVAVLREGLQALGAQTGYVGVLDEDAPVLDVRRIDADTGRVENLGRVSTDEALPITEAARTGMMLLIGDNEQLRCEHPRLTRMLEDDHACASLPLLADGRVRAVLNIGFDEPRAFEERDHELYALLLERASIALERALLSQELEHRASASYALEHVGDAVFLIDQHGRVRLWNPAAVAVTQVPASRAVGFPIEEVIPGWEELAESIPTQDRVPDGAASTATISMTRLDGSTVLVDIGAVSGPSGRVYAFRDVTDAERLERAKRDFVATVSHELRTPLTSIMGGAMTLQRDDLRLGEDARQMLLDTIVTEAQRLASIAGQVLQAARFEAGAVAPRITSVDVERLVHAATDAARTRHPAREIRAHVQPAAVAADAEQLRQVLDEVIENALKYSPPPEPVDVHAGPEGDAVVFRVIDRGVGVSHHDQRHLFEMFYRADASMSRGVGGAGLGLHIARQFVTGMAGSIGVESAGPGQGSTVTVRLPRTRQGGGASSEDRT